MLCGEGGDDVDRVEEAVTGWRASFISERRVGRIIPIAFGPRRRLARLKLAGGNHGDDIRSSVSTSTKVLAARWYRRHQNMLIRLVATGLEQLLEFSDLLLNEFDTVQNYPGIGFSSIT